MMKHAGCALQPGPSEALLLLLLFDLILFFLLSDMLVWVQVGFFIGGK